LARLRPHPLGQLKVDARLQRVLRVEPHVMRAATK
jgi:hypothetical protein